MSPCDATCCSRTRVRPNMLTLASGSGENARRSLPMFRAPRSAAAPPRLAPGPLGVLNVLAPPSQQSTHGRVRGVARAARRRPGAPPLPCAPPHPPPLPPPPPPPPPPPRQP